MSVLDLFGVWTDWFELDEKRVVVSTVSTR